MNVVAFRNKHICNTGSAESSTRNSSSSRWRRAGAEELIHHSNRHCHHRTPKAQTFHYVIQPTWIRKLFTIWNKMRYMVAFVFWRFSLFSSFRHLSLYVLNVRSRLKRFANRTIWEMSSVPWNVDILRPTRHRHHRATKPAIHSLEYIGPGDRDTVGYRRNYLESH